MAFGKERERKRLLRDGAQARGVITEVHLSPGVHGGYADRYWVKLRVQFDDGSTVDTPDRW